ncbi:hypothetical protein [Nonomuraea aridisoli]|uniref:CU044_5270 family protein n=1 Tax=Nonomuraea aridisoli TaxID=2070368 RepID=A0A2W2FI76_9ACTN|nr:hypothetical protein [Nonomuraea aridisoli]PZG21397.1 hypothetical protein C1J01_06940 [Nonomuraea aridisoli]
MRTSLAACLAAATAASVLASPATAAAERAPEGGYWHTKTVQVLTHPRKVGRDEKYWVVERRVSEEWSSRDGRSWVAFRRLGATPKTAADRAAWKRDGSPDQWSYRTEGMLAELSREPEKGFVKQVKGGPGWIIGYTRLTFEELQAAPADPEGLVSWLRRLNTAPGEPAPDMNQMHGAYENLLHNVPVPKAVRRTAYEVLSKLPGVTVADAGKNREKLTYRRQDAKHTALHTWVIDTKDMLLVERDLDTVHDGEQLLAKTWTMTIESGWTNREPAVPGAR